DGPSCRGRMARCSSSVTCRSCANASASLALSLACPPASVARRVAVRLTVLPPSAHTTATAPPTGPGTWLGLSQGGNDLRCHCRFASVSLDVLSVGYRAGLVQRQPGPRPAPAATPVVR